MTDLLLLHGALGTLSQFDRIAPVLEKNFRVHRINLPGHGGISFPKNDFSIESLSDYVLNYLDSQQVQRVNIFGYSMGGYIALWLAIQHPERINSIFTLATKFDWSPEIAEQELKQLDPVTLEQKVPAFTEALRQKHAPNNWQELVSKCGELMLKLGKNKLLNNDRLSQIQQPVRISVGDRDKMISLEESIATYRKIPNGSFMVFPGTPHPFEKLNEIALLQEMFSFFRKDKKNIIA